MGRRMWMLALMGLLLLAAAAVAWSAEITPITTEGPLVDKASLEGAFPMVSVAVSWPTAKELKEKGAPSTADWPYSLDKVLRPEVMPPKLREELQMIKGFPVQIRNARIGRWQLGQYQIQVAEQPPSTVVVVKDTKAKPNAEEKAAQALFKQVTSDLFQQSKEIQSIPYLVSQKFKVSASYGVTPVRQAVPEKIRAEWYGRLDWWSDGQTVIIWVPRWSGGPTVAEHMKPMNIPTKVEVVGPDGKPVPAPKPAPGPVAPPAK